MLYECWIIFGVESNVAGSLIVRAGWHLDLKLQSGAVVLILPELSDIVNFGDFSLE